MARGFELPTADCRACGESLRGGWDFAVDDLFCGLCGRNVFRLAFREEVVVPAHPDVPNSRAMREIWIYATAETPLAVVVWGVHGIPGRARSAILPELDYDASFAEFDIPGLPRQGFRIEPVKLPPEPATLANPDTPPTGPLRFPRSAAAILRLVPRGPMFQLERLPSAGAAGSITLAGPHGGRWAARMLRLPNPVLEFSPAGTEASPPELVGFQDASGSAEVQLTVTARARVVLSGLNTDEGLHGVRRSRYNGIRVPCELNPGQQVRLGFVFEADANPEPEQSLTINWMLAAAPRLIPYNCKITLVPRPRLTVRPSGTPPEELIIGGRPTDFQLLLEPDLQPGATTPVIQRPPEFKLDPPEGEWLRLGQALPTPFHVDGPFPVRLTVDGSKLDRSALNGKQLSATVNFTDQSGTIWPFSLRVRAVRLKADEGVVSLDWGTTNTCAAHATGPDTAPRPLALPPPLWRDDPPDYEQFPSVIYVEDLTDPEHPVFHLGPMVRDLADLRGHPECLIHSLKRRFMTGLPVYVRDELGREHAYPVEDLTRRVLLRLVELAEHELGREIRHLGLTFPTKWPAATRRRFDRTLRRVAEDLSRVRRHGPVDVYLSPADIDEANAVALNVLRDLQSRGKLVSGKPFTLIAYDFGGGTIDTSVLRVTWNEDVDPPLITHYLGIGGRGDFGGDEVTRATVLLLRDRINKVLETNPRLATETTFELPIRRAGDPPEPSRQSPNGPDAEVQRDRDSLRNWEQLRRMAEEIKRRLCRPAAALAPETDPVREAIQSRLTDLMCHPASPIIGEPELSPRTLETLLQTAFATDRDPFFAAIRFGLAEIADYQLSPPGSGPKFSVRDRVRDTFLEVKAQLADAGNLGADLIVLAGGGCRLPLVTEMVRDVLGPPPQGVKWDDPDRLIYDPKFAKQRVAHGKATYLALARESDFLAAGVARSVEVLHRPLVVTRPSGFGVRRETVVAVGERVDAPNRWHPFPLTRGHTRTENGRPALWLSQLAWKSDHQKDGGWESNRLGYFDLGTPVVSPSEHDTTIASPLPPFPATGAAAPGNEPIAEIRLTRVDSPSEGGTHSSILLELRVRWPDGPNSYKIYGNYPFVAQVPPGELDERLQGECS